MQFWQNIEKSMGKGILTSSKQSGQGQEPAFNPTPPASGGETSPATTSGSASLGEPQGNQLPVRAPGDKTRGVLVNGDGTKNGLISGKGEPAAMMPSDTLEMRSGMQIRGHAEAQAAALMREGNIENAPLYINNTPCSGIMGCDQMLPHMLPEGAELRVYFKDEVRGINDWVSTSYKGLPDSSWQRYNVVMFTFSQLMISFICMYRFSCDKTDVF